MVEAKKIVIVCGYPKSGSTWTTRLVAQLLQCPSAGYWGVKGKALATEGIDRESEFVCYQAHHYYDELRKDHPSTFIYRIIYVVRDPRDIVTSGIYHFNFHHNLLKNLIKNLRVRRYFNEIDSKLSSRKYKTRRMLKMLSDGDPEVDHCNYLWDQHVKSYINQSDVLFLKYEDLLANTLDNSRLILEHCHVTKNQSEIKNDINQQSFEYKKKAFLESNDSVRAKHLRKGVTGDWKMHLSDKSVNYIRNRFGETMDQLGYN